MTTLTPEELVELTGAQQRPTQERVLVAAGIPYFLGADGKIRVWRSWVDLAPWKGDEARGEDGPNWGALFDGTPQKVES